MSNPYVDPKTETPYNRLGIDDKETLRLKEAKAVAHRLLQLKQNPIHGDFGPAHLQAIHKHILQDVYEWAGKFRTLPMRNSLSRVAFAEPEDIASRLQKLADTLKDQNLLAKLSKDEFAFKAAVVLREINAVHGFPDGNGRAQREMIRTLGLQAGYKVDFNIQSEGLQYNFNKASRLAHNDGNLTSLAHLLRSSTSELPPPDRQASHTLRDERKFMNTLSAPSLAPSDAAKQALADRDLKLLAPYLPEGRIPPDHTVYGNLHFWEVKDGDQTTKYAVGVLEYPNDPKPDRDLKAQSAVSKSTGFDAGHLIGHQFGGPEIPANLSLQNPAMNQGGGNWYKLEAQWANDLRAQNRVAVVVKEVTRSDTPNFLYRTVNSLTIDQDGKVQHDELSALNPETERALAAQGRAPAPEVSGGATILDLRPSLDRHEQIGPDAEQAAEQRLNASKPAEPKGYKHVIATIQNWRAHGKNNELKPGNAKDSETEPFGTLGGPDATVSAKTQKELETEAEANKRLLLLRKQLLLPELDKMTSAMNPKTGDVTFHLSGKPAMIDRGKTITVLHHDPVATRIALEMAVQKYGRSIAATGTETFQKQLIEAALKMRADITFTDPKLQARFVQAKAEQQKQEEKARAGVPQPNQTRSNDHSSKADTPSPVRDPERTFTHHADTLQQRYGFGLDATKADGIIALKMAQTGWQPEDVAAALKTRRLNTDLAVPTEVDAYAKKLTVQAFGKAAREAALERNATMDLGR